MGLFQLTLHIGQLIHQFDLILKLSAICIHKFLITGLRLSFPLLGFLADLIQLIMELPVFLLGGKKHFDQRIISMFWNDSFMLVASICQR